MIGIISGTNRKSSNSLIFSKNVKDVLLDLGVPCQLLSLEDLPVNFFNENEAFGGVDSEVNKLSNQFISNSTKFVFVIPEYNGSFPGVLKAFIDSFFPKNINNKKALLIGVSSGRGGNMRGLDHFTGVLHYLNVHVLPQKIAASNCNDLIDFDLGKIKDEKTNRMIKEQLENLIAN